MNIKKVGVVGCGLMGAGIAQVAAQASYDTTRERLRELAMEDVYEPMVAGALMST